MKITDKIAKDIVMVLKLNTQLTDEERILAVSNRLETLVRDVEVACAENYKRAEEKRVIIDNRPQDIPVLRDAMLKDQERRGMLN